MDYIVAGCKPWNRTLFDEVLAIYPGTWHFAGRPEELAALLETVSPRYIFFLHWSWKVPPGIVEDCECVCFHMTDVPYGRGGSPLQNLVWRGHQYTALTALRMTKELDAGPVYLKKPLGLGGNAEAVYIRAGLLASEAIHEIICVEPVPWPQAGKPVIFERRRPSESRVPNLESKWELYDFIRMLDADGYPHAFLEYFGFRFEFSRAALYNGKIVAEVTIT